MTAPSLCEHDGCDEALARSNKVGRCRKHRRHAPKVKAVEAARRAEHRRRTARGEVPTCKIDECETRLRSNNIGGFCGIHRRGEVRAAHEAAKRARIEAEARMSPLNRAWFRETVDMSRLSYHETGQLPREAIQ